MSGLREYYSFIIGTAEGRELSIFFFLYSSNYSGLLSVGAFKAADVDPSS